jgi:LmbE family N-acetylglucosaminyl deacetylase
MPSKNTSASKKQETIIVCSAHSDDFVIGAGGTIANYTKEGKKVIAIIFSYGENSHPWLKEEIVQKMRAKETLEASKLLHCETIFYDLKELNFIEDAKTKKVNEKLLKLIKTEKPTKIFTHSNEDPHPDHKGVHQLTLQAVSSLHSNAPEIYIYSVWNPVSFKTLYPALFIDITNTFKLKLESLKTFRSQKVHVAYPFILLLFRAIHDGIKIRKRFGEKFFRIK